VTQSKTMTTEKTKSFKCECQHINETYSCKLYSA